jgi:Baseplate J-like protein
MAWGLTPDGFNAKTLEEIEAGFVQQQRDNIDPGIDTSQFGLIGQLNGIMASEIASLWELAEAVNDSQDPNKAGGASQDALYSLTGTPREDAQPSLVMCSVTLQPGTAIGVGEAVASVVGNPSSRFANAAPMVNATGSTATVSVLFEATEPGPTVANANTLTNRETLITGWDSVTNPEDAQLGSNIESDAEYRQRREDELFAQGGGTVDGIRGDLLQLDTVIAVNVIENTDIIPANGLPPKSFCAIVRSVPQPPPGDDQAIAECIWGNKPAGIEAFGTEPPVTVVDSEGEPHLIRFSRPLETDVYLALRVTTDASYIGHDNLKTILIASAETPNTPGYLDVGVDVYAGRFVTVAMAQRGVLNAEARVSFSSADYDTGVPSLAIAPTETAVLDTSRISIVAIP